MRCLFVIAVAGFLLATAGVASAGSINVYLNDEYQGRGNKGTEFRPYDDLGGLAPVVLTALTSIDPDNPFDPYASAEEGTVYIHWRGAGVQAADPGWGSKPVSGRSTQCDEQLNFTFDDAAIASSIQLGLIWFKPEGGDGADDDAVLFINLVGDDEVLVLDETEYLQAWVPTGPHDGYIDFGLLDLDDALIESFGIRETNGRLEVSFAPFTLVPLPVPVLMGLAGLAAAGCASRRIRRRF